MGSIKKLGLKKRLISEKKTARSAPRWADIKKYGLKRSITRSIKRVRSRHWRRNKIKE